MQSNAVIRRLPDLTAAQLDQLERAGREPGTWTMDAQLAAAVERVHQALSPMEVCQVYAEVEASCRRLPMPGWYRNIGQAVVAAAALGVQAWARISPEDSHELLKRWAKVCDGKTVEKAVVRLQSSDEGLRRRMALALAEWD